MFNFYAQDNTQDWERFDSKYRAKCVRMRSEKDQEYLKHFLNDPNEDVCEALVERLTSRADIERISQRFLYSSKICAAVKTRLNVLQARIEVFYSISAKKIPASKQKKCQKKPLILSKEILLFDYYIKGTVACMEKCSFPRPLLLLLKEEGNLESKIIAEKLLQNKYQIGVAEAWLNKILALGLVQKNESGAVSITEQGEKYLESGQCFVPKDGEWIVTCCEDERVKNPIFSVKSLDTSRMNFSQRIELTQKQKDNLYSGMPSYVEQQLTSDKEFGMMDGKIYMFKEVDVQHFCAIESNEKITLNWNVTESKVWVNCSGHDLYADALPEWAKETESELILKELSWDLKHYGLDNSFRDENGFIHVPYNNSYGNDILISMQIKSTVGNTSAGKWDNSEISCDLVPLTENDARLWFNYLVTQSVNRMMTEKNFEELIKTIEIKLKYWTFGISDRLSYLKKLLDARMIEGENRMFINAVLDWQL